MKKQSGIVILISNKTDLKQKLVRRCKQKHFLLSKEKKNTAIEYQYILKQTGESQRNKWISRYTCPIKLNQDKMNNLN